MPGKSNDPKDTRITVRIGQQDLATLQDEARRSNCTVGAVVRRLIRTAVKNAPAVPAAAQDEVLRVDS